MNHLRVAHESNNFTNNNLQSPPTNATQVENNQMEYISSNVPYNNNLNISHDFSNATTYTTSNYEESSFMDNQLTQYYPQYISPLNDIQFSSDNQNNFPSLDVNSSQTVNSEIFKFNIPGFKIIVIPDSVYLANIDMQNLFQDSATAENSQSYLQNSFNLNDSFNFK
jgi:hypothetical protein